MPERELAEHHVSAAEMALHAAPKATSFDAKQTRFLEGNAMLLLAIYHELSHGHDQQAAQSEAIRELTRELSELSAELRALQRAIGGQQ